MKFEKKKIYGLGSQQQVDVTSTSPVTVHAGFPSLNFPTPPPSILPATLQIFPHDATSSTSSPKDPSFPVSIRTIATRIISPIMATIIVWTESPCAFLLLNILYPFEMLVYKDFGKIEIY
jgi:hypothetical protein